MPSTPMKERGFSLIEAVVAMAITGVLVAGVSLHFRNLFLRQMDLLDQAALLEMAESVIQTLGNNQACMATFNEHCSNLDIDTEGACTSAGHVWTPKVQVLANRGQAASAPLSISPTG